MKLTNDQLIKKIETLRANVAKAHHAVGEASVNITLDDLLSGELNDRTIALDKATKAYHKAEDILRHAEGVLESRQVMSRIRNKAEGRQVVGDLIREKIGL